MFRINIDSEDFSSIVALIGVISFFYYLWDSASHWHRLDAPYRQIAWFYWHTLGVTLLACFSVFMFFWKNELTGFDNLDLVIGLISAPLGALFFIFVVLTLLSAVIQFLSEAMNIGVEKLTYNLAFIYVLPLLFLIIWYVGSWLFS